MKKRLLLIALAVLAALCTALVAVGCGKDKTPDDEPPAAYTVTVRESENGRVGASAETVDRGGSVTLTVYPDSGYMLDVLTVNDAAVTVAGDTYVVADVQADIVVSATFKKQTVTVTFRNAVPSEKTVEVGAAYGELPEAVGTPGKRFVGWFTEENGGGAQITATTVVTATTDHTLYPYFVNENEVLVSFDYGAGIGRELTRALEKNDAIGELPEAQPPLNGALFGWFAGETQIDETFVVTEDVTVRASYITATLALKAGSTAKAVGGADGFEVKPELEVSVQIDGAPSDEPVTLDTTDATVATVTDGKVIALKDGEVRVRASYGGTEICRTDFVIVCRNYADYTAISDKAGLVNIRDNPAGKYYLTTDIDFAGGALWDDRSAQCPPLFGVFTGVLDGMGHAVKNAIAHPSGWDQGAFTEMRGTVRDIAFTGLYTQETKCANNGFFGKLYGVAENVFLDIEYRYKDRESNGSASWGALAAAIEEGGTLKNCVVNLTVATDGAEHIAGIAYNAANFLGRVENCFVVSNGAALNADFDGLYFKESAADESVAAAITVNSAVDKYLVGLINSQACDITKLGDAWEIKDGALYFFDMLAISATPEYVIVPTGDVNYVYEDLESENLAQVLYNVAFMHNGVDTDGEVPENVTIASSAPEIAELVYDADEGVFVLYNKTAGTSVITISVGDCSASFTVTLTQIMHIASAQEFIDKISANPAGTFLIDEDIDFAGATVQKADGGNIAPRFTGVLDGQNHTVSNFRVRGGNDGGIFRELCGTVKNVAFVGVAGQSPDNYGGLFYRVIDGGAVVDNVYLDYEIQCNGNPANKGGTLAGQVYGAEFKNVLINLRFADGFDVRGAADIGAVVGSANAWAVKQSNIKIIVNGIAAGALKNSDGGAAATSFDDCEQFAGYAAFYASAGKAGFTAAMGWAFEVTGISFGERSVLAIPEYTLVPEKTTVTAEFAEGMDAIVLNVDAYNYIDKLDALPAALGVASSDESVATVAIADGRITVTPCGVGETVITLTVGEASARITVKLAPPAEAELAYDGETELALDYETAGKLVAIGITAQKDGEACAIPADVTLGTDNAAAAEFTYNAQTSLLEIKLNGEGNAELTAQIGAGAKITVSVKVSQVFHISNADEFRTKLAAHLGGKHVLDNDVDLGGGWGGTAEGVTLGNFSGVLDGRGYKVSNFWLPGGWANGGLFNQMTGTVKNIAFVNVYGPDGGGNVSGLFQTISGGAVIENVYLDYEVQSAAADAYCGPLAFDWVECTVRNVIINLRFKAGLTVSELKYGSMAGRTAAWSTHGYDNKVILNGAALTDIDLSFADGAGGAVLAQIKNEGSAQYSGYADFAASDFTKFDDALWSVDATGITFGSSKVLDIAA